MFWAKRRRFWRGAQVVQLPQQGGIMRVNQVLVTENWPGGVDYTKVREEDGQAVSVPATGNTYAAVRFGFEDPQGSLEGNQNFKVRVRCTANGGGMRAWLYEGGALKRDFGTFQLQGTEFQTITLEWNASEISNKNAVEIKIVFFRNLQAGEYVLDAVWWEINVRGWQRAWLWGQRPRMGSHFGPSQIFKVNHACQVQSYGNNIWNQWINFFEREPDIVSSLSIGWDLSTRDSWEDIAGGPGTSVGTFAGQLYGCAPLFCTNWWPADRPIQFVLGVVPENAQAHNKWNKGPWRNPSIWFEIKRGDFDAAYRLMWRRIAHRCVSTGRDPRTVAIRMAHEMSGDWFPWSVGPDKQSFIDGWRRIVDIMREAFDEIAGPGKYPLIDFSPDRALRFGNQVGERLWNIYPGDDYVDIVGIGFHDTRGVKTQEDWDMFVRYNPQYKTEGWLDWMEFGDSRGKWLGTGEIAIQVNSYSYWPRTERPDIWWNGFEALRRRFPGRWLYTIYMFTDGDHTRTNNVATRPWNQLGNWGEPMRQMYKLNGLADQWGDSLPP